MRTGDLDPLLECDYANAAKCSACVINASIAHNPAAPNVRGECECTQPVRCALCSIAGEGKQASALNAVRMR